MADSPMNYEKKQELIEVSTTKSNDASVGIMGKIKDFIEDSLYNMKDGASLAMGDSHFMTMGGVAMATDTYTWSLEKYRRDLKKADSQTESEEDEYGDLDELEKSIVANIASDVQVGVAGDKVKLVIIADF